MKFKRNRYSHENFEPVPGDTYLRLVQMADAGIVTAQFDVGKMYDEGTGVSPDHSKAIKYYTLAANQGDEEAKRNLEVLQYYTIH